MHTVLRTNYILFLAHSGQSTVLYCPQITVLKEITVNTNSVYFAEILCIKVKKY